jgi:hypothetical protein
MRPQTWELIDKLRPEKIPLAGIARVADLSADSLQAYVCQRFCKTPHLR